MTFLRFRYRLGYESFCREVNDSIAWRRFCRIPLEGSVPNPTTLMKLTARCGPTTVEGLNEARLVKAAAAKLVRAKQVRVDTTVVPSNVSYPTDSGVLAKAPSLLMLTTVQAALLRKLDGLLERRGRGRPSPTGRPRRPGLRRSRPASRRYSGPPRRGLPRALMLVRLAALVAVDAPPSSYLLNLEAAGKVGLDAESVRGVLAAVAPIVGTARVVSATGKIVEALSVAIEIAEEDAQYGK